MEPYARDALALGEARDALDLNCGEGWIAHRLLDWGARLVVARDERPDRMLRARLLREHFAVPATELDLRDPPERTEAEAGMHFDLVVVAGAADRLIADTSMLAAAATAARSICAIECRDADANAVARAALEAGFVSVERASPPLQADPRFLLGELELLIAKTGIGG